MMMDRRDCAQEVLVTQLSRAFAVVENREKVDTKRKQKKDGGLFLCRPPPLEVGRAVAGSVHSFHGGRGPPASASSDLLSLSLSI